MAEQEYWAAAQATPGREHLIRAEIENLERGAFLPTMARTYVTSGKLSAGERPLMPGYVFFRTDREDWGDVQAIDGVQRVIRNGLLASPVNDTEMIRLVVSHATGAHNDFRVQVRPERREKKSSRKPRPGKRIRARKNTVG